MVKKKTTKKQKKKQKKNKQKNKQKNKTKKNMPKMRLIWLRMVEGIIKERDVFYLIFSRFVGLSVGPSIPFITYLCFQLYNIFVLSAIFSHFMSPHVILSQLQIFFFISNSILPPPFFLKGVLGRSLRLCARTAHSTHSLCSLARWLNSLTSL